MLQCNNVNAYNSDKARNAAPFRPSPPVQKRAGARRPLSTPLTLREPQLPPPTQVSAFFGVQTSRPV